MNETLLQAENELLKAEVKFLLTKLSLLEQKPYEPKKEEFVAYDNLNKSQLKDINYEVGRHMHSGRTKAYMLASLQSLEKIHGMKWIVKSVKRLHSKGLHKDVIIYEKACS
jgi:hypothetical protein